MKKLLLCLLCIALMACSTLTVERPLAWSNKYQVEGGRVAFDFSDKSQLNDFKLLTEFDLDEIPRIVDEKLVFWSLAEQKAIYTPAKFSNVDVSVDIGTINNNGKFDAGIYVQLQDLYSGVIDGVSGWCVNLERGAGDKTYYLKLHKFNHKYEGCKVELKSLKLPMNLLNLRVVVKDGVLHAFVNGEQNPRFSYEIGNNAGYVGLRSFYSPNWFDNLSIIGAPNAIDFTQLDELLVKAEGIDFSLLTTDSANLLQSAIAVANSINKEQTTQYAVDEAVSCLQTALNQLLIKRDYVYLQTVIERAESIQNPSGSVYTKNSWDALQLVLARCKTFTEQTPENEVSYWANRLALKIDQLIVYGGAL